LGKNQIPKEIIMSSTHIVIAIVLLAHGLGHILAIFPIFGLKLSEKHSFSCWLIRKDINSKITGFGIWFLSLIGFISVGFGLLGIIIPVEQIEILAKASSVISLIGLVFFWNSFPFLFPNKIGVIIINIAILVYLSKILD
jgi:hypothetical protein